MNETYAGLGTKLRTLMDRLDSDLTQFETELGLSPYRPRYSPFVRALVAEGPASIRDLARAVGVTHSAASQTIAQMSRDGLVEQSVGKDARQRVIRLTERAEQLMPLIDREWAIDEAALADMDTELPSRLLDVIEGALLALERRSWLERLRASAGT